MCAKCEVVRPFSSHLVFNVLFYERKDCPLKGIHQRGLNFQHSRLLLHLQLISSTTTTPKCTLHSVLLLFLSVFGSSLDCIPFYYFGGAWSKGLAMQSWHFWDKIGHAKSVGFRFYSAIWRSESRISSRYFKIASISLNRLTCVTLQMRGDS